MFAEEIAIFGTTGSCPMWLPGTRTKPDQHQSLFYQ
jgi:hypothetical protein